MQSEEKIVATQNWLKPAFIVAIILIVVLSGTIMMMIFGNRGGAGASEEIIALVNGEEITRDEFFQAMMISGGQDILDRLIRNRLILQEGERLEITVSDEEIDAEIEKVIAENFYGMADYFYMALNQHGISEEEIKEDVKIEVLMRKIVQAQIDVTEEDIKDYFTANQHLFNIAEQVEARHILVDTREEGEEVLQLLAEGQDFVELVNSYSKDYGSVNLGGNLGFFRRGEMVPEFDEAAFSLAVGERSGLVETMYGFHIIEVLDRKEAREVTFEEVKDEVEEKLLEEKTFAQMGEQLNKLWENANIEYL